MSEPFPAAQTSGIHSPLPWQLAFDTDGEQLAVRDAAGEVVIEFDPGSVFDHANAQLIVAWSAVGEVGEVGEAGEAGEAEEDRWSSLRVGAVFARPLETLIDKLDCALVNDIRNGALDQATVLAVFLALRNIVGADDPPLAEKLIPTHCEAVAQQTALQQLDEERP